jgi:hypothetical protein
MNTIEQDKLVDSRDAEKILGLAKGTLSVQRCRGTSPIPYVRVGKLVKYRVSELQRYIESQTVTPTPVAV